MSGEILFRRAKFGGFNRDDVMQYISTISVENGEKEKIERELSKVKAELSSYKNSEDSKSDELQQLKAENEALKAEISAKTSKVSALEAEVEAKNNRLISMQIELESRKAAAEEVKEKEKEIVKDISKEETTLSAERLMQDSMAYAERYIQSAGLVAGNIKRDTLDKLNKAGSQLVQMRETASQLSICSEKFNLILEKLAQDVDEAARGFEQKKEEPAEAVQEAE